MAFRMTPVGILIVGGPGAQVIIDPSQPGAITFPTNNPPAGPATIGRDLFGLNNVLMMTSPYVPLAGPSLGTASFIQLFQTQALIEVVDGAGNAVTNLSVANSPSLISGLANGFSGLVDLDIGPANTAAIQGLTQPGGTTITTNASSQGTLNYNTSFPTATDGLAIVVVSSSSILNSGLQFFSPINRFGATVALRNSSTGAAPGAGISLGFDYVAFGH